MTARFSPKRRRRDRITARDTLALAGFFLSGFAALVYEICWIRKATLVFGSTTHALSTVLAIFFLGFALGCYFFGKFATRTSRPLLWFAALEIALGLFAIASPWVFQFIDHAYGWAHHMEGGNFTRVTAKLALIMVSLLFPTVCMGGTLPLFCRQYVRETSRIASAVGSLYALNTVGACLGCWAAGMVLIPSIGVNRSIQLAAALNLITGLAVAKLGLTCPISSPKTAQKQLDVVPTSATLIRIVVFATFFVVGFVSIGNEVLWTRFLSLLVRTTVHTYTITLTVVLAGLVIGSLIASRLFDRSLGNATTFGLLQTAASLAVLTSMLLPPHIWQRLGDGIHVYLLLLLPAAILSGMTFPLAVRLVSTQPELVSLSVGRLVAINTLGGIFGSTLMGFVVLPGWGLKVSLLLSTGVGLLTGMAVWFLMGRMALWRRAAVGGVLLLVWFLIPPLMKTQLPASWLAPPAQLVDFREGLMSHVAVVRTEQSTHLEIDRWWQGDDRKNHQIMAAHLPMLVKPKAQSVLVVGVGTGQTLNRFLMHDIRRLDCVEIEPAVFPMVQAHFDSAWMEDPRVRIIDDDGRNFVAHTRNTYDIISLELGQVFRPGVASFYTAEFYQRAAERLAPGGVVCQFVPTPFFRPTEFRRVVETFRESFPHCTLWYNTAELLLIGTISTPIELDEVWASRTLSRPAIRKDLAYSHWGGSEQWLSRLPILLGCFLAGPQELEALGNSSPLYRDDRPELEYAASRVSFDEINEIANVQILRQHLGDVVSVYNGKLSASDVELIRAARERNLDDMVAGGYLRRIEALRVANDYEQIVRTLAEALRWNPNNARANRMMGDALVSLNRFDPSRAYYRRALQMRPGDGMAHRGFAVALHRLGNLQDALSHYQTALSLRPGDAELHNNLGAVMAQTGKLEQALQSFQRAVELDPDNSDAKANLDRARRAIQLQSDTP